MIFKCLGLTSAFLLFLLFSLFPMSQSRAATRSASADSSSSIPKIRVLIGSNLKEVKISGLDLTKKVGASSKKKVFKGRKSFFFNCKPLRRFKKFEKPLLLSGIHSSTGLLSVNAKKYRGSLQLIAPKSAKGCDIVNTLSLETYIGSVLAKEMSSSWPLEALKAQAVAARSYAYFKIKTREVSKNKGYETYYDLENSERHQVNGDFFDVTVNTSKAQRLTSGEMLVLNNGEITPIFFHSKCGGKTRRPDQVWENQVEGYQNVECPFCHKHGTKNWKKELPIKDFFSAVNRALSVHKGSTLEKGVFAFKIPPNDSSDASLRVYDDDKMVMIKKSRIRSVLGRKYTLSNSFSVKTEEDKVVLEGKGFGHGVGLCQYGAFEMAKRGYTYKEILNRYFPAFSLKKMY